MKKDIQIQSDQEQLALSKKDEKKWHSHYVAAQDLAHALVKYGDIDQQKQAERVATCSEWLEYRASPNSDGRMRLQRANFCHVRGCPICEWWRTIHKTEQIYQNLPGIIEKLPKGAQFIFLTLTVADCKVEDLRKSVDLLNCAFHTLIYRTFWKKNVLGYIRSLEVTHSYTIDNSHPRLHVLLAVRASCSSGQHYMSQRKWTEEWKSALKVDYTPILNVRTLKDNEAVLEICKYCVKEQDILVDMKWFVQCMAQLREIKTCTQSGVLKRLFSDQKDKTDKNIMYAGEEEKDTSKKGNIIWYRNVRRSRL